MPNLTNSPMDSIPLVPSKACFASFQASTLGMMLILLPKPQAYFNLKNGSSLKQAGKSHFQNYYHNNFLKRGLIYMHVSELSHC